jgi:hypothetical protein
MEEDRFPRGAETYAERGDVKGSVPLVCVFLLDNFFTSLRNSSNPFHAYLALYFIFHETKTCIKTAGLYFFRFIMRSN